MNTEQTLLFWQVTAFVLLLAFIITAYGNISLMNKNNHLMEHINSLLRKANQKLKEEINGKT